MFVYEEKPMFNTVKVRFTIREQGFHCLPYIT
jgi:hypothetical protein